MSLSVELLSEHKLRKLLSEVGEFPVKYRPICWKYLLKLPGNCQLAQTWIDLGVHPLVKKMLSPDAKTKTTLAATMFAAENMRLEREMSKVLSAIVHWNSSFGLLDYLPKLIFPFVMHDKEGVATGDRSSTVSTVEIILTFFFNWGSSWLEHFPNLPFGVFHHIDSLLSIHAPNLFDHFQSIDASAASYAWPLLSSLFSQVLNESLWLKFCDHLFANSPKWLPYFLVAYLKSNQSFLINSCASRDMLKKRVSSPIQSVYSKFDEIIVMSYKLLSISLASSQIHMINEENRLYPIELIALPKSYYPDFIRFPSTTVNDHLQRWKEILAEEDDINRKRKNLYHLQQRADQLQYQQKSINNNNNNNSNNNMTERCHHLDEKIGLMKDEFFLREKKMMDEKNRLDEMIREERLRHLKLLEQEAEETQVQLSERKSNQLKEALVRLQQREMLQEAELRNTKLNQSIANIEFAAKRREIELNKEKEATVFIQELEEMVETKTRELQLNLKLKKEQAEAEEAKLKISLEAISKQQSAKADIVWKRKESAKIQNKLKLSEMEFDLLSRQELKNQEIERYTELENLAKEETIQNFREAVETLEVKRKADFKEMEMEERMKELEIEKQQQHRFHQQQLRLTKRRDELERQMKSLQLNLEQKEFKVDMLNTRRKHTELMLEDEKRLNELMIQKEEEEKDIHNAITDIMHYEKSAVANKQLHSALQQAEDEAILEERKHFDGIRNKLVNAMAVEEKRYWDDKEKQLQRELIEKQKQAVISRNTNINALKNNQMYSIRNETENFIFKHTV